jgi:hypothetical protein
MIRDPLEPSLSFPAHEAIIVKTPSTEATLEIARPRAGTAVDTHAARRGSWRRLGR